MQDSIIDTQGKVTPFAKDPLNPMAYSEQEKAEFKQKVEALRAAPESELIDETPTYWNPRAGEFLIGTFIGQQSRTDKKTGEMKFLATFHDGIKLTVAGQVAIMDFARTATYGCAYKITCLTAVSEKAKTFKFQKQ